MKFQSSTPNHPPLIRAVCSMLFGLPLLAADVGALSGGGTLS